MMTERAARWLFYTCFLGLLPILCRFAVWSTVDDKIAAVTPSDVIVFGIVLHSANINEVNRISSEDRAWQVMHNGTSTIFLVIYSLFLFGAIWGSKQILTGRILVITTLMALASIALSIAVIKRSDAKMGAPR